MPKAHIEVVLGMSWDEAFQLREMLFTSAPTELNPLFRALQTAMKEVEGEN